MTGINHRRPGAFLAARGRLLTALLVVALLLCHGAFGALHLLAHPCDPCNSAEVPGTHHSAAQEEAAAGDAGGGVVKELAHGAGYSVYFAVVVAFSGAMVLKLLLGGARKPVKAAILRPSQPRHPPLVRPLSLGPTPPLLQVFRL